MVRRVRLCWVAAVAILLAGMPAQSAARFVEIVASRVNIRTAPRLSAKIVTRARRGDIFPLRHRRGRWYEIEMFSGEPRYVFAKLARPTSKANLTVPPGVRKRLRREIRQARDRARREAARAFPLPAGEGGAPAAAAIDKAVTYELLLVDRYLAEVFHRLRVAPAAYGEFRQGPDGAGPSASGGR